MARVQHNCTGCVPIDASIIEVYTQLISTESRAEEAAERAEHAAEHAIGKSPYIGENGDWWEWNDEQAAFIDTGVQAQGQVAVDIEMSTTSTNPVQNRVVTAAVNEKYTKPATGIPATDIAEGVIPDVSQFITASVNNLVNYYLKSETYNKTEVDSLISAVSQFSYEVVATLPTASASTMYKIYLVPSARPETQNVKDEYITIRSGSEGSYTYAWEQIGSTAIDLSGYVTTQQLNTALSAYTTTANLTTLLAAKQDVIADLATIRSGAASGATAYQKPSGGIPKSDLASGVQGSLDLADSAIQARPQGEITPVITPADYATREELGELEAKVDEKLDGVEITNPEWIWVITDNSDRVLGGIKEDGSIEWCVGVPTPVREYVDAEIAKIKSGGSGTAINDIDKIISFLSGFSTSDTLVALLNDKVDKVAGKSLIDAGVDSSLSIVNNPEYLEVTTDAEGKILGGRYADGRTFEKVGIDTNELKINGVDITKNADAIETTTTIYDPENRLEMKTDMEERVISFRDSDGVLHECVGIDSAFIRTDMLNLTEDGMDEFQQALKNSGFSSGAGDWSDKENLEIPMPRCAVVNITNDDHNAVWPASKTANYRYYIQFWDMQGNYFKKPVIYNAQGSSSLGMPKKNSGFDMFADTWDGDAFTLKIGDWIPQDSFHLKAYYSDYFVGVCPISYKLFNQITETRDIFTNRDWKKALIPSKSTIGVGCNAMASYDDKYSLDNDARCFPDGFPCIVYLNGEFWGVYSWQLKKQRDNYMLSKKKPLNIHLDGCISDESVFLANGNINWGIFNGIIPDSQNNKEGVEIRNPKPKSVSKDGWILTCIDGTQYDWDNNPKELIGVGDPGYDPDNTSHSKSNQTKQALITLSTYIPELKDMENNSATPEQIRSKLEEYFDVQGFIDYLIFSDITTNFDGFRKNWQWITYDGIKWFIEPYDLDGVFGWDGWGTISPTVGRYGNNKDYPTGWIIQYFQDELEARYGEMRQLGIFTTNNILKIFRDWIAAIGTENYQKNHDKWPIDREHYPSAPVDGHFDNIYRVSNWLDVRISKCDEIYNYNG